VCEFRSRRRVPDLPGITALHAWAARYPLGPVERGLVEAEFGMNFVTVGAVDRALDCYRVAAEVLDGHPELALVIATHFVGSGQTGPAGALLQTALEDDKTRTAAHVLLARVAASGGAPDRAKSHLERATAAAPAWADLLDMLASVIEGGGASALREKADRLRRQRAELAVRLG
jgi:cytochrome c-type biogenesis protein CcmH/NrfG